MELIYYSKEEFEKSNFYYDKYIELNLKNDADFVHFNKGLNFINLKNYENALKSFDKALEINKDNHMCFYHKAKIFLDLKKYKESLENFDNYLLFINDDYKIWNKEVVLF